MMGWILYGGLLDNDNGDDTMEIALSNSAI